MTMIREGLLHGGLPYLAAGTGPPVVVFPGIGGDNADPAARSRRRDLRALRPLTRRFSVHVVNRRPGLAPGATLHDLAGHYAAAIEWEFGAPVPVVGISTGGSIAQVLAIDRPELVSRLVLIASACRLSAYGREVQRTLARNIAAGKPRRAWAASGPSLAATATGGRVFAVLMWLFGTRLTPSDPADLLVTVAAEDAFDAEPELYRIIAPTLILGGARDRCYSPELFRETARRIPDATLRLHPDKGHFGIMAYRPALDEIERFLSAADQRAGTGTSRKMTSRPSGQ